jgi:hypothetical protein
MAHFKSQRLQDSQFCLLHVYIFFIEISYMINHDMLLMVRREKQWDCASAPENKIVKQYRPKCGANSSAKPEYAGLHLENTLV